MIKNVAITGSRGRLAPLIADDLLARGTGVKLFSREGGEGFLPLASLAEKRTVSQFDAILHLAWSSVPFTAEQNLGSEEKNDFPFLKLLLDQCAAASNRPRLIFFSTAAVYGNCAHPATEEMPCLPLGRYARAKLRAENLIRSASPSHCVLRVTNVFGFPDHSGRPQGIIPRFCDAAHDGSAVTIWGDGLATKDYLFFGDFLSALRMVIERRLEGTFNVASGQSISLREIIAVVSKITGRDLVVHQTPHFPWDVERTNVSAEKLRAACGWTAEADVRAEIEKLIRAELR